jgi:hypothetical protein
MRADSTGLLVLTDAECWRLLAGGPVGRVVVSMDAMPAALPVNYQLIGREIFFRTAPGTKLTAAVNRTVVAFQVDEFDADGRAGWSVLVVGTARLVTDPGEQALLEVAGIPSWVTGPDAHYVAIAVDRITGRRLRSSRPATGALWDPVLPPRGAVG